jgi:hypothetical protein
MANNFFADVQCTPLPLKILRTPPKKTNEYHKITILYVILSGARSAQSNFRGLSEANKRKRKA